MYDRILLATDGERASERATVDAVELAAQIDAALHAVYVVDEAVYAAYSGDEFVAAEEGPEHGLEEAGRDALAAVADRATEADVAVETRLVHGVPETAVADTAADLDADLVVLGTESESDPYRRMLGSVTNAVVQTLDRPVLVVKTPEAG